MARKKSCAFIYGKGVVLDMYSNIEHRICFVHFNASVVCVGKEMN